MRILHVHCHPVAESFGAAVRDAALDGYAAAGHEVRLRDLYADGFEPVMEREERLGYHEPGANEAPVAEHVADLRWAEGLVFSYPTWWFGQPAMLKGWLDRVMLPHVAFTMPTPTEDIGPGLRNVRLVGAFSTLGCSPLGWLMMGRPGRNILMRGLRACCHPRARTFWEGLHRMDSATPEARERFLARVRARAARLR